MRIAYIVYEGMNWLNLIGVYEPVSRLKSMGYNTELTWDFCAFTESTQDKFGLAMKADRVKQLLEGYDAIIIPGGVGVEALLGHTLFIEWLKTAASVPLKISTCTGSLLLGKAGFLTEKKATTHFAEYDTLREMDVEVLEQGIVEDGNVISSGTGLAAIELGLYLCEKWSGTEAKEIIQKEILYNTSPVCI